jgi:hypothetical protein
LNVGIVALTDQNGAPSIDSSAVPQNVPSQAPIIHGFLLALPIPARLSTPALGIIALEQFMHSRFGNCVEELHYEFRFHDFKLGIQNPRQCVRPVGAIKSDQL